MRHSSPRLWFLAAIVTVFLVWLLALDSPIDATLQPLPEPDPAQPLNFSVTTGAAAGYVEDQACATCHADLYQSYQHIGMSQSFTRPQADKLIENFALPAFFHRPSQRYYQMSREGDDLIFRRWQLDQQGQPINKFKRKVDYMLGSGHKTRSYLYQEPGGEMFALPVSWYSQLQQWGMPPGYDNADHSGVTRAIQRECLFCHNAFPQVPEGSDNHWQPQVFPQQLPQGIGCQRCHGPGANHIQTVLQGATSIDQIHASIVNPAKLEPAQRDSVCFQCHLMPSVDLVGVRDFARPDYSFRPGEDINDYIHHVEVVDAKVKQADRFEINHHGYRLRQSQCFIKSANQLTCISCHNPHQKIAAEQRAQHYDPVCKSCHSNLQHQPPLTDEQDCVSCHMPQRRTQDVVNVVVTDHKIQRNDAGQDWLAPLVETAPILEDLDFLMADQSPKDDLGQIYKVITVLRASPNAQYVDYLQTLLQRVKPKDIQPYLDLADGQLSIRRFADAEKTSRWLMTQFPENFRIEQWLATALMVQGKNTEAEALFKPLLLKQPKVAEIHFNYALLQKSQNQPAAALASLEKALALRPSFIAAWYYRAKIASELAQNTAAIEYYQQTLALDPAFTRAYLGLAKVLVAQGDKTEALRYLKHGQQVARDKAAVTALLGELYGE